MYALINNRYKTKKDPLLKPVNRWGIDPMGIMGMTLVKRSQ